MTTNTTPGYRSENWRPDPGTNERALTRALAAVGSDAAAGHLATYYASESDYAGATFTGLDPSEPNVVTPTDLLAVTTLSVKIGPQAVRNFCNHAGELTDTLAGLDSDLRLETADPAHTAEAMASLHQLVKTCLAPAGARTSNAWVTASKICARKRPNLFPVRDNLVLDLLGLPKTYPVDWPAFRTLLTDQQLVATLDEQIDDAARRDGVDLGDRTLRLRHLDVILWMHSVNATN